MRIAPFMPQEMQDIGTQLHRAASRFAIEAQSAASEVTRDTHQQHRIEQELQSGALRTGSEANQVPSCRRQ